MTTSRFESFDDEKEEEKHQEVLKQLSKSFDGKVSGHDYSNKATMQEPAALVTIACSGPERRPANVHAWSNRLLSK
jgi:hypothetical protein